MDDPIELSLTEEEVIGVCFLLWCVDRLVMEPMLEEYREDLGVGRMGDAKFDSGP